MRVQSQTDQELLKQIDDDKVAKELHQRLFVLRHSLSEREMKAEDKVMELKTILDKHNIEY